MSKRDNRKKYRNLLKQVRKERGYAGEQRVLIALEGNRTSWPEWLISIRKATEDEDIRGCDIVAETDVGKLYLQIKSSKVGIEKFHKRNRKKMIAAIISYITWTETEMSDHAIKALVSLRKDVIALRRSEF